MLTKITGRRSIPGTELWVREISFKRNCLVMADTRNMEIMMPYKELVAAYIEICDERTGSIAHPDISEVTEELEGCLVLYDREYRCIRVRPVGREKRAGAILKQLAIHAPYLFWDYMPWMDEGNQEEFFNIRQMVSAMRDVSGT